MIFIVEFQLPDANKGGEVRKIKKLRTSYMEAPLYAEPPPLPGAGGADSAAECRRRGRRKNKRNLLSTFKKKLVREDSHSTRTLTLES